MFLGDLEGRLPDVLTFAGAGEGTFGEVDHHQFPDAHLEDGAGGVSEGDGIEGAVGLADTEAGDLAGFVFIHDEVVGIFEGGNDEFSVAIGVLGDDIDGGTEAGILGFGEEGGAAGHVFFIGLIEGIKEQEVAQVEDFVAGFGEVEVGAIPDGVGAAEVEEGAATIGGLGHDVGVGRGGFGGGFEEAGLNFALAAIGDDAFTAGVLAYQSGAGEGEGGSQASEIDEDIVRGAAGAQGLGFDGGEFFDTGVGIDDFDFIDDPVSSGKDAGAGGALVWFGDDNGHTIDRPRMTALLGGYRARAGKKTPYFRAPRAF